jgi:hypothetical protein
MQGVPKPSATLSVNFVGSRVVFLLVDKDQIVRSWAIKQIWEIEVDEGLVLQDYFFQRVAEKLSQVVRDDFLPLIQDQSVCDILISRQRYRGARGMFMPSALPSAFLEAQLYAVLAAVRPAPKVWSICPTRLSGYFEMPLFGQELRTAARKILDKRLSVISEDSLQKGKKNVIELYIIAEKEHIGRGGTLKSATRSDLSIAALQAIAWKEWQRNTIYWEKVLEERQQRQ